VEEHQGSQLSADQLNNPTGSDQIAAAVNHDITGAEWVLGPLHRQWSEAILWFAGEHYLEYGAEARRWIQKPSAEHVPRSVTNYIMPHVETGAAILQEALPAPRFVPETGEDKDRIAAENAQGAMRYRDEAVQIESKKRDACMMTVVTGQCYLQAIEDRANQERVKIPLYTKSLEPIVDEETGEPILGPDGQPMMEEKEAPAIDPATGQQQTDEVTLIDENVHVIAPFEIIPDWSAKYPSEFRRYTHFRPQSRDWVGRAFGSTARKKVKAEREFNVLIWHQMKVMDILSRSAHGGRFGLPGSSGGGVSDWRFMDDMVVIKARYMLPNDERPDGRLMIVAGHEILHDGKYPYGDRLNLFTLRWSVVPGSLYAMGMVRNLISPQKRLNGIDTQVDLIRKTMGSPQWISPKGVGFDGDRGSGKPGRVFTFKVRGGYPAPTRLTPAQASGDSHQQRAQIIQDMEQISGMMNVLRGDKPVGIEAGVAIEALTEQAGKRFQPAVSDMRAAFKSLYLTRLEIMRNGTAWKYPRAVPLVGENNKRDLRYFDATDFRGSLTVDMEAVPLIALSHAIKSEKFIRAVNFGLIDLERSIKNREKGRALLNVTEFEEYYTLDYKRAQMENEQLLAGEHVAVQEYDNHEIHFTVLMELVKSREFNNYPDTIRRMALEHAAVHRSRLEAQIMLEAQAELAAGGAAGAGANGKPRTAQGTQGKDKPQRSVNNTGIQDMPNPPQSAPVMGGVQ